MFTRIRIVTVITPFAWIALAACGGQSDESSKTSAPSTTAGTPPSTGSSATPTRSAPPPPPGGGGGGGGAGGAGGAGGKGGGGGGGAGDGGNAGDAPPPGTGPKSCAVESDCQNACPPGSIGCTCADTDRGRACIPTCVHDQDCPKVPDFELVCSPQSICMPKP